MPSTLFTIFLSLTWGLGLLFGLVILGILAGNNTVKRKFLNLKLETEAFELMVKKSMIAKMAMRGAPSMGIGLPEKLKELMKMSPNHPEVNEIEEDDEVVGVVFPSDSYPPEMDDDNENDDD
jgi:hypothetical protein